MRAGRHFVIFLSIALFFFGFDYSVFGQNSSQAYSTLETTKTILKITDQQIQNNNLDYAEYHAKIASSHFANNFLPLKEIKADVADEVHLLLLDLPSLIKSDPSAASNNINQIFRKLDGIEISDHSSELLISNLLIIAEEEYQKFIDENDTSSYILAKFLFTESQIRFKEETSFDNRLSVELDSFFIDLIKMVDNKENFVDIGTITSAIQRDLVGTENVLFDEQFLYNTIRDLYRKLLLEIDEENYAAAEEYAIEAYLDNFEYLEPNIEKADPELLLKLELDMREELRSMIRNRENPEQIRTFLEDSILPDLASAENKVIQYLAVNPKPNAAFAESGLLKEIGDAPQDEKTRVKNEIDFIRDSLQAMLVYYEQGDFQSAYATARTAYLDSYEYVEIPLRPIDPDFTLEVEYLFAELRNSIKAQDPFEKVQDIAISIRRNLDESERLVTGTGLVAPAIAFSASFAIIFREGLESVLILGAIITYLEASRNTKFKPFVYYGIVAAIGATAVTWVIASYVVEISGASKELIEAIAALSATAVLFYVSFWILNKIEHKKWMEFVKAKVWQATTTGGVMVFVLLSFFTVYREGFETVLFYQAMFGFAKYMESYVGIGFVLGIASLLGIYFVMRKLGKKLPLRVLFGLTMGIGAYLSIAFLGNAIREFQILDIIPYTSLIGTIPRLDINMAYMTGIYPTLETLVGQIILLAVYLFAAISILIINPRRVRKVAKMRKSWRMEDAPKTS